MSKLKIVPEQPIPDRAQPTLVVEYTCGRCGKLCRKKRSNPGFLPRYCESCIRPSGVERTQKWRKNHPEEARATAKRQNDKRPLTGSRRTAAPRSDVNDASLTSDKKPADLTRDEWITLRDAAEFINASGGACALLHLVKERTAKRTLMSFPYRNRIDSLVRNNYLAGVNEERFESPSNPRGEAQALTDKARGALGIAAARPSEKVPTVSGRDEPSDLADAADLTDEERQALRQAANYIRVYRQ